jgi:hypothetical protein
MIHAPTVFADKYLVRSDYKINGLTRYSYIPAHAGGAQIDGGRGGDPSHDKGKTPTIPYSTSIYAIVNYRIRPRT